MFQAKDLPWFQAHFLEFLNPISRLKLKQFTHVTLISPQAWPPSSRESAFCSCSSFIMITPMLSLDPAAARSTCRFADSLASASSGEKAHCTYCFLNKNLHFSRRKRVTIITFTFGTIIVERITSCAKLRVQIGSASLFVAIE